MHFIKRKFYYRSLLFIYLIKKICVSKHSFSPRMPSKMPQNNIQKILRNLYGIYDVAHTHIRVMSGPRSSFALTWKLTAISEF